MSEFLIQFLRLYVRGWKILLKIACVLLPACFLGGFLVGLIQWAYAVWGAE